MSFGSTEPCWCCTALGTRPPGVRAPHLACGGWHSSRLPRYTSADWTTARSSAASSSSRSARHHGTVVRPERAAALGVNAPGQRVRRVWLRPARAWRYRRRRSWAMTRPAWSLWSTASAFRVGWCEAVSCARRAVTNVTSRRISLRSFSRHSGMDGPGGRALPPSIKGVKRPVAGRGGCTPGTIGRASSAAALRRAAAPSPPGLANRLELLPQHLKVPA